MSESQTRPFNAAQELAVHLNRERYIKHLQGRAQEPERTIIAEKKPVQSEAAKSTQTQTMSKLALLRAIFSGLRNK